jgi:hypothetical protein
MPIRPMRSVAACLLVGALSVGCQNTVAPLQNDHQAQPDAAGQMADFGQVDIRVRWPQAVQAIPYSANALHVVAFDGLGRVALQTTLTRGGSPEGLGATSMRLRAGTYTIEARAYRETSPSLASEPTAIGSVGSVRVKSNLKTSLALTLNATPPTSGALSPAAGGVGAAFTIDTVQFFGRPVKTTDIVEVFMGQVPAAGQHTQYRLKAATSIEPRRRLDPISGVNQLVDPEVDMLRVIVPRGLKGACKVWLRVDNVEIDAGTFHVVDRMTVDRASVTRAVGETYDAPTNLRAFALDTPKTLTYPAMTWRSSMPNVAFVTTGGMVYAYRPGRVVVTGQSGDVAASFELLITNRHSTASIDVDVPDLGAGTVEATFSFPVYSGDDTGTVIH